jgi:hypothetical protein
MRQSSSWYFEVLFHRGTSHDRLIEKFFCLSIPSLKFLILSDGDPRNCIAVLALHGRWGHG